MESPLAAFMQDPKFWVSLSFFIFFALFGKTLWRALIQALDQRVHRIQVELGEAQQLRKEAESLLAFYQQKHRESMREAEAILAKAREDAERIARNAEIELKAELEGRMKHTLAKIELEEKTVLQDVKQHIIDITITAARSLIIEHINEVPRDALMQHIVTDLERKVH